MNMPKRRKTRPVNVGKWVLGNNEPIRVQSMTCTRTSDVEATVEQIRRLMEAGCEIARVAVPDAAAADSLSAIKKGIDIPLVADIHFNVAFALKAIISGCDKIRINPGNLGGVERFREVLRSAKTHETAIRIGVNSGSVEKELLEKHGGPTAAAMVESALRYLEICESEKFDQVVVSIKASHALEAVAANRLFSKESDYPLHLGITEAGGQHYGTIKSAVGIGSLLLDGIGDTIRVSLTGDPVLEIPAAYDILKASGARVVSPEVISCPTCGRLQYDMARIAEAVEKRLRHVNKPLRVAIMGCMVNGPGEAREADVALAGGKGEAVLYVRGIEVGKVGESEMVDRVVKAVEDFV